MRIRISEEASVDLDRLREFIAEKNPDAAQRIASELHERIQTLQHVPRLGRMVPDAPNPDILRDFITTRYVVRYQIEEEEIVVLRVWHQREDWKDW